MAGAQSRYMLQPQFSLCRIPVCESDLLWRQNFVPATCCMKNSAGLNSMVTEAGTMSERVQCTTATFNPHNGEPAQCTLAECIAPNSIQ